MGLASRLRRSKGGWGSLPENCERFDDVTCKWFSLHEVVELLIQIKYLLLTIQPGNLLNVSKWMYTGRFFDFDDVTYRGPRFPRESNWTPHGPYGEYTI